MPLDQAKVQAGYDKALAIPEVQAAFGYGPGSAGAKAQVAKFTERVNAGNLDGVKAIHAAKGAAALWDKFVPAFVDGYGDPGVADILGPLKAKVM